MSRIDVANQRAIIDRRAVAERLRAARRQPHGRRGCDPASEALAAGRAEIARRLAERALATAARRPRPTAFLTDQIVRLAYDFVACSACSTNPTRRSGCCWSALGGYGPRRDGARSATSTSCS